MEKEAFMKAMGELFDEEFAQAHMIFVNIASDRNISRDDVGNLDPNGPIYLKHIRWALLVPDESGMGCIIEDTDTPTSEVYDANVTFEVEVKDE